MIRQLVRFFKQCRYPELTWLITKDNPDRVVLSFDWLVTRRTIAVCFPPELRERAMMVYEEVGFPNHHWTTTEKLFEIEVCKPKIRFIPATGKATEELEHRVLVPLSYPKGMRTPRIVSDIEANRYRYTYAVNIILTAQVYTLTRYYDLTPEAYDGLHGLPKWHISGDIPEQYVTVPSAVYTRRYFKINEKT